MNISIDTLDEKLFLTLNGNHHGLLDYLMLTASNLFSFIPVFLLCVYIAFKYFRQQDDGYHPYLNLILLAGVLTLQYFICHNLLEGIFKSLFYRERPCENPGISAFVRLVGRDCNFSNHSFFSFKPCLIFCITSFLFFTVKHGYNAFKFMLILWAVLVAYSRIYVGAHYPMNVLISAVVGIMVGLIISKFYFYIKYRLLVI